MAPNREIFERARDLMPGGVSSPVRAFRAVGGEPVFIERAEGARLYATDGREFLDYVGSWGPMILGHAHPRVTEAVREAASRGTSYGMPCPGEAELAARVREAMPGIEKIRFVSSGTEAVMSALRLARAATGCDKIVKFEGGYHGHADFLLAGAGSGLATLGIPSSPGVPADFARHTLTARYNDLPSVEALLAAHAVAAVIVEPVAGNMGVVPPAEGFLSGLRRLCGEHGALLVFDEVITGFRVSWGGAQERFGVRPDLTTLGKILGGGLPVGAYGGRAALMDMVAPEGKVYQAGTLSGNPLAMTAGCATLDVLRERMPYTEMEGKARTLAEGLRRLAREAGLAACVNHFGSVLALFFCEGPVTDWETAKKTDTKKFAAFFHSMLERGIHLPPSNFEAWFLSAAHSDADVEATLKAAGAAMKAAAAV
jgi:glutamate-1-semialdehyde 2,1-aminomutase